MFSPRLLVFLAGFLLCATAWADEYDTLRVRWAQSITGAGYDTADTDVISRLTSVANTANSNWASMDKSPARTFLWSDAASTTNSSHLTTNYGRLRAMAMAYATPGCSLEGNAALLADLIGGLDWMDANRYNSTKAQYDNWWDWEIGTPLHLTDMAVLLYDQLTATQRANYMNAVNFNTPTPDMTQANKVWKARVVGVRGCVVKYAAKLVLARDAFSAVFPYVTSGDGFYTDGSFIQHDIHPYTAGYGASLLSNMAPVLDWLAGSTWAVTDPAQSNLYRWIYDSVEPIIYRGAAWDLVRGREISRSGGSPQATGHSIIQSILRISQFAPPADAARMRSMVKYWALNDPVRNFVSTSPLNLLTEAKQLMADPSVTPRAELIGHYTFAEMDRVVHLAKGFGFGLSLSSSRIARFESINGENMRGWLTGDGMTILYNGDLNQYGDAYWATVDHYRLPGITVDTVSKTPPSNSTRANGQSTLSTYNWVGGAMLGSFGAAGMQLDAWNVTLTAKKSWFMFDDEVVCLGAGISSTDNRPIETIVENRRLLNGGGGNGFVVNGVAKPAALGWTEAMNGVNWAYLAGNVTGAEIGYYFPQPAAIKALREARTGSWADVDTEASTAPITRNYLRMSFEHGSNPTNATYQYVLLPGRNARRVGQYAAQPQTTVLANTSNVQAVTETTLGLTAANFWTDAGGTAGTVTVGKKASVLVQNDGTFIDVAVSDPTQANTGSIAVQVAASATAVASADAGVTVTQTSPTIALSVAVNGSAGRTFRARFYLGTPEITDVAPVADAYVYDAAASVDANFGTATTLVIKKSGAGFNREAFLRFNVPAYNGVAIGAALKLTTLTTSTPGVHGVSKISDNAWIESGAGGITWNNKPAAGAVLSSWTPAVGTPVEADVLSAISGSGPVSFRVAGTTQTADGYVTYAARENGTAANRPRLSLSLGHTPPVVALTAPVDGALINRPGITTLAADAAGTDGAVTSVTFFSGANLLGSATGAPYSVAASLGSGTHLLTAVATDANGLSRTSLPVRVDVAHPPVANTTTAITSKNTAVDLDLRTLVSDADTALAKLVFSVGGAGNGTVALLSDGHTARFTPTAGYFGPASFGYTVTDATDDPRTLLHYTFQPPDDPADFLATDVSGNDREGTLRIAGTGVAAYTADVPPVLAPFQTQSLQLAENGTAGAAKVDRFIGASEFDFQTAHWTAAGWFKRAANTTYDVLFHLGTGSGLTGSNELQLRHDSGSNNFRLRNDNASGNDVNIQTSPSLGVWHHFAVVRNGGTLSLYVDGAFIGSDSSFSFTFDPTAPVVFGGNGSTTGFAPDRWFNGSLADLAIFSAALTPAEITKLATSSDVGHFNGQTASTTVSLTVRSNLESWRLTHFGTAGDEGTAADTADLEFDGFLNLLEFALGTDPKVANPVPCSAAKVGGTIEFTYARNKAALGELTHIVEWSDTLAVGSWSVAGVDSFRQWRPSKCAGDLAGGSGREALRPSPRDPPVVPERAGKYLPKRVPGVFVLPRREPVATHSASFFFRNQPR
jgi:hyaluronate lyase